MRKKTIAITIFVLILAVSAIVAFYIIFPPQSQIRSRIFGGAVNIELPKDCKQIVFISFAHNGKETRKYLSYINFDGELISKEYRDYKLLEGEIKWTGFKQSMIKQNTQKLRN